MRQLIAEEELSDEGFLYIKGEQFHYLKAVLRVDLGDMIQVRLPNGSLQPMTVAKIDNEEGKRIVLQVAGSLKTEELGQEERHEFFLFQFVAKPAKMDIIIRQATECGVSKIIPVEGEFCQKGNIEGARRKSCGKDARWQRIITEARQQSGSPVETKVLPSVSVQKALRMWQDEPKDKIGIVLYERSSGVKTIQDALKNAEDIKRLKVAIVVGCEGGISQNEIKLMEESGLIPIHFETNILRCETASLYGLAVLQTLLNGE